MSYRKSELSESQMLTGNTISSELPILVAICLLFLFVLEVVELDGHR
jgi:hypothetical protein